MPTSEPLGAQGSSYIASLINHLPWQIILGGSLALGVGSIVASWLTKMRSLKLFKATGEVTALSTQELSSSSRLIVNSSDINNPNYRRGHAQEAIEIAQDDDHQWNEALEELVEERTRELAELYEQLQAKEAMCRRLLGKVLTVQEEERARLARELHDTIGQSLTAIIMTTTAVENSLPTAFASRKLKLANVRNIAAQALQDLRNLIFDLRPEILDDLGLSLALRSVAKKCLEPIGIQMKLKTAGLKDHLPQEVETAVFRVVQEAITNIARHSQANKADISLTIREDKLIVRVEDNGIGFDSSPALNGEQKGWGLRGMEERVTFLGGKFYAWSRPRRGTLILAEIPLDH